MKGCRVVVNENDKGGPEKLKLVEFEVKEPGADEVLIEVKACGINYIDTYHRSGLYAGVNHIGREGSGIIIKLGSNVKNFTVNESVCWWGIQGSYTTHLITNVNNIFKIPEYLVEKFSNKDNELYNISASIPLQCLTAHYLTNSVYKVSNKDSVLIHAGAGGTGGIVIQMCKLLGCKNIITTVSTEDKKKLALNYGANHVIIYTKTPNYKEEIMKYTNNLGCDVVYDGVGKTTWEQSLSCVKKRGMLVLFGNASGPVPPIDPLKLTGQGSIYLIRPNLKDYAETYEETISRFNDIFKWIQNNQLQIHIGHILPLNDVQKAHQLLESRNTTGKVILVPKL